MHYNGAAHNTLNVSVVAIKVGRILREIRIFAGFNGKPTNGNCDRIRVLAPNATNQAVLKAIAGLQNDFNADSLSVDMAPNVEKILARNS